MKNLHEQLSHSATCQTTCCEEAAIADDILSRGVSRAACQTESRAGEYIAAHGRCTIAVRLRTAAFLPLIVAPCNWLKRNLHSG